MIRQLHSGDCISAFGMRNSYWGKRIYTYYCAYGTEYDFCKFYGCSSDDFFAVIMLFNSTMTIWSQNEPCKELCEELSSFVLMYAPEQIEAPLNIAANLRIGCMYTTKHRTMFKMVPNRQFIPSDITVNKKPNLDKVYDILSESFEDTMDYGLWLTDTSHRRRRNLTKLFLYADSSTATILFDDDNYAFVGHIATRKAQRGKGSARKLLYYIAAQLESENKSGYLYAYDHRAQFYQEIGFENVGDDYIIIKTDTENRSNNDFEDFREY